MRGFMQSPEKICGLALIVLGLLILLFTFYEAFVLFNGFVSGSLLAGTTANATPSLASANNTTEQALISQLSQNIVSGITKAFPINMYFGYTFAILLLGVFASVGYKIAKLGIELGKTGNDDISKKGKA